MKYNNVNMHSEVSQIQKNKHHMILIICGIQKKDTYELIYKTEVQSEMQKMNLYLPGGRKRKNKLGDWERYIHTTIHKIDNL